MLQLPKNTPNKLVNNILGQFKAEAVIEKNYISNLEKYIKRFDNEEDQR